MSKLYLYHVSFFDSMFKGLKASGVNVDKYTQQSSIRRFDLNDPDTYLPLQVAYDLFDRVKHSQGVDCMASEFYGDFKISELGDYGTLLYSRPDVKSILLTGVMYDYLAQTNSRMTLEVDGAMTWFTMKHLDTASQGRLISEKINVVMILRAINLALGDDWTPVEIRTTAESGYWLENLFESTDFRVTTNCAELAFGFKTSELFARNKHAFDFKIKTNDICTMEGATQTVLNSMKDDYIPSFDEFATYFGNSKSTLIREFAGAKTSFKRILEKRRFELSIKLLQNNSLSIEQISARLGYASSANFARAFKRWTNSTPRIYRKMNAAF